MTLIVDPAKMRLHATEVDAIASQAQVAADAARQTSFHSGAYGLIGGMLVYPAISGFEAGGVVATQVVPSSLHATATAVRAAASGFEHFDAGVKKAAEILEELLR